MCSKHSDAEIHAVKHAEPGFVWWVHPNRQFKHRRITSLHLETRMTGLRGIDHSTSNGKHLVRTRPTMHLSCGRIAPGSLHNLSPPSPIRSVYDAAGSLYCGASAIITIGLRHNIIIIERTLVVIFPSLVI